MRNKEGNIVNDEDKNFSVWQENFNIHLKEDGMVTEEMLQQQKGIIQQTVDEEET